VGDLRDTRALRRGLFALATLAFAAPSGAGELVAIRVGEHPAFTRVVFELDVAGGYRIERDAAGEAPDVVRVTLDAASPERRIASGSSGVEAVAVEAGSPRSVARIDTRGWVLLHVAESRVTEETQGRTVTEVLKKGDAIRRKRQSIMRGNPERLAWSDESARAAIASRFLGAEA